MFVLRLNIFLFFWHFKNRSFLIGFLHFLTGFLGFFDGKFSKLFDGFILTVVLVRYFIEAIEIVLSIFYELPVADGITYDSYEIIIEDFKRG